jgi:hypothetical protein
VAYQSFRVTIKAPRHKAVLTRWQTMFGQEADDLADLVGTLVDAVPRARAASIPPPGPVNDALQRGLFIQTLLKSLMAHAATRLAILTDEAERLAPEVTKMRATMEALERAFPDKGRRTYVQ